MRRSISSGLIFTLACAAQGAIDVRREPVHLRAGAAREWKSFPPSASGVSFETTFQSSRNTTEHALLLHQRDIRHTDWKVSINGRQLGVLEREQEPLVQVFAVPAGLLRDGANQFELAGNPNAAPDDIEVREIRLEPRPVREFLGQATVDVDTGEMPSRITVVEASGAYYPFVPLTPGAHEALRPGTLYTATGKARIGLPPGSYRIYASRGFEFSAPSAPLQVAAGESHKLRLPLRREVAIPGYAGGDTHVHTLEVSRHGDASIDERVLTIAGEGLDWAVTTEHNMNLDYIAAVRKRGLDRWYVSIPGNEVTTAIGHFNIFPVQAGTTAPDFREGNWDKLMRAVKPAGTRVVIQNHPRDVHSGYKPFAPVHHIASIGENRNHRPVQVNAMEVVNSAAMASNPMRLVLDWMGLLTRGMPIAAIGSSDTHTVMFAAVGQARTYIDITGLDWRRDPDGLAQRLAEGRNLVSYGLAARLQQVGAGAVRVEVWGPSWAEADRVTVYRNGTQIWQSTVARGKAGLKLSRVVKLPGAQDAVLVAVATGPGVRRPFWRVMHPPQPEGEEWTPMVLGISNALRVDRNGDGVFEAPMEVAAKLLSRHGQDLNALAKAASECDAATVAHVVNLLWKQGVAPDSAPVKAAFEATPAREAYLQFVEESKLAR